MRVWALTLAAVIALAGCCFPPSAGAASDGATAARSYRIATSEGFITRLGPWRMGDPTLGRAIAVLGRPTSISGGGPGCNVRWRYRRIAAIFANLGGQDACDPQYGRLNRFTVRSRVWRTIGGLRVGHSTDRLRDKYPDASLERGVWNLVAAHYGYGPGDGFVPTVSAVPRNGRVAALTMYVGGAGE